MEKNSKIYIAGHLGLVGSALVRNLTKKGYTNIIGRSIDELNLGDYQAVDRFLGQEKPDYVILAAAKVGGIVANNTYRGQFIYENLQIQNNVIHLSYVHGVKKLLFLGSSCIYPKACPQPIMEEYLLTDPLEYTNEPYAIAKIAGIKLCESYNLQYNTNFIAVMPTNLFGPNDNYDLEKSHVLPALIRKMHLGKCLDNSDWGAIRKDFNKRPVEGVDGKASEEALLGMLAKYGITKDAGGAKVSLWGTGSPKREFLYSDDMADACVYVMENVDFADLVENRKKSLGEIAEKEIRNTHINIGTGRDLTIRELAEKVKSISGFAGELVWDSSKPDGTMQKLLNVDKIHDLGWKETVSLDAGITKIYADYQE
ncbi:MAG: GDP-L-fucose synthase [Bacteroidales bacterium]|nr:GDP-L-fucose synthase [Bacteroidales bacterium]